MQRPTPAAVLELLKPITWFAPMWAFACGVVSSGLPASERLAGDPGAASCSPGPLVCATSQAVNDWFDRHVDAINEPNRPIPSGRIPGRWGLYIAMHLDRAVAGGGRDARGRGCFGAAVVGLALAWAYSAPPLRLKQNGWWGNLAVGACYEGLPWFTGAAVMAAALPDWRIIAARRALQRRRARHHDAQRLQVGRGRPRMGVALAAGAARRRHGGAPRLRGHGAAAGGRDRAAAAAGTGRATRVIVAALLVGAVRADAPLLGSRASKAAWYNATGTTLYVLGMLVAAFALRRCCGVRMSRHAPPRLVRHRPPRPGADGARRHRRADHLDAQPRDGGRTGAAGHAAGRAGRAALRACRCCGRAGATAPTSAAAARPGSSAAWRSWRLGGVGAALATALDGDQSRPPASRWRSLAFLADRHRRRRGGHLAAGAAGQARRRAAARAGRHHRLDHDDRRLRGHRRRRRPACSIRSRPSGWSPSRRGVAVVAFLLAVARRLGRRGQARPPRRADGARRPSRPSATRCARCGPSPRRGASPSSSSSRCSPTARRT